MVTFTPLQILKNVVAKQGCVVVRQGSVQCVENLNDSESVITSLIDALPSTWKISVSTMDYMTRATVYDDLGSFVMDIDLQTKAQKAKIKADRKAVVA